MKYKIIFTLVIVILVPVLFFTGYNLGALHERGLDAPGKAALITLAVESYENNDELAHKQMLSYIDVELTFYEEYLDLGIPLIAILTDHNHHIKQSEGYLQYVSDFINSSNNIDLKHKKHIRDRLELIQQKSHNKSLNLTGAENAPSS